MRVLIRGAVAASVAAMLLSACSNPVEEATTTRGREIIPEAGDGIVLARQESGSMSIQGEEEETSPRIELESGVLFISAIDVNLDIDEPEEQIVVIKRADDSEDRVRLLVTDFDPLRSTYRVTWEGVTRASNVRTFAVYTMDVVGDHQDEIVAVGTDENGQQTMNVFRRRMGDDEGTTLSYREIFAAATDGSIEIDEVSRSDSYRTLQSDGESFSIQVYRRNADTDSPSDLILTDWEWRPEEGRYEAERTVPIPAVQAQEEQLREMYDADAEELEDFLAGPWFRASGEEIGASVELALFDPDTREAVLYRNNSQEQYRWLNSYKTLYADGPGLWMNLRNDVLATVRRQLSVTVEDLDTISISVEGAEYWNGRYERMTPGIQSGIVRELSIGRPSFELSGVYSNENGVEILFDRPQFRFRTRDFDWSGGYNLIQMDQPILELKVTESDLVPSTARPREDGSFSVRYAVEYTENESDGRVVRRLTLNPVQITADGPRRTGGVALIMEQVEESEESDTEEDQGD
ncbi:MAG: pallilysin-related adhesin [Alkalispirochaeta sp.]